MVDLIIDDIKKGNMPGITKEWGNLLAQAGLICFNIHNHHNKINLEVKGDYKENFKIIWSDKITDQIKASWNDLVEATEYGAYCFAILLTINLTDYIIIEKSARKTGFDYWLGNKNDKEVSPFQKKARLEVSGILKGDENKIKLRLNKKNKQTVQSDYLGLKAHIVIIEFSKPLANYSIRN